MLDRGALMRLRRGLVLDHVGKETLAVADGRIEADGIVDEAEEVDHLVLRLAGLLGELGGRRLTAELLRQLAANSEQPAQALGHLRREQDRTSLLGHTRSY